MTRLEELENRFAQEPLAQDYGIRATAMGQGQVILAMTVEPKMTIVGGVAQGGVVTVLADYAGVYAAMSVIPTGHTPCRNINIHFLRPIKLGVQVHATGQVVNVTRNAILVKVTVVGPRGRLKATALMEFARPKE